MIKFAVPYNGDINLIDKVLAQYNNYTESFFGNFGIDDFGGGRAQKEEILNSEQQLKEIITKLDRYNIDFNYVINNTSSMNNEFKAQYISRFKKFLTKLIDLGVKKVTLCNPYLIKFVKKEFPHLKISASVNFKTRTIEEVRYLVSLGCDEATLHYDLIKNFKELKMIRQETDMLLKLIPNDLYIMNCPWQKGHTRMQGSHSRYKDIKTPYFSYYRNKCVRIRSIRPEQIFMAKWIAPSDISKYTEIGFYNFKLLDRLASTDWILNVLKIYLEQKKTQNLEEILGTYGSKSNIDMFVENIAEDDNTYPREKLEVIPIINSSSNDYWYSEKHDFNCISCGVCKNMAEKNLIFPEYARTKNCSNNMKWQNKITKISYIEKLNNSNSKRIEYI